MGRKKKDGKRTKSGALSRARSAVHDHGNDRVIARHSAVMRDQKFGNAPPAAVAAQSPEEQIAALKRMIEHYSAAHRFDDIREARRRIAELEGGRGPPIIHQTAKSMRAA
jgi:hypothetical protein